MGNDDIIEAALSRLDADIADTEAKLADLREKRRGAEAFLEYARQIRTARGTSSMATDTSTVSSPPTRGTAAVVEAVMRTSGARPMSVADVLATDKVRAAGLDRTRVRNGLHYLKRIGLIESAGSRGVWQLKTTNADGSESTEDSEPSDLPELAPEGGEHTDGPGDHHSRSDDLEEGGRNDDRDRIGAPVGANY